MERHGVQRGHVRLERQLSAACLRAAGRRGMVGHRYRLLVHGRASPRTTSGDQRRLRYAGRDAIAGDSDLPVPGRLPAVISLPPARAPWPRRWRSEHRPTRGGEQAHLFVLSVEALAAALARSQLRRPVKAGSVRGRRRETSPVNPLAFGSFSVSSAAAGHPEQLHRPRPPRRSAASTSAARIRRSCSSAARCSRLSTSSCRSCSAAWWRWRATAAIAHWSGRRAGTGARSRPRLDVGHEPQPCTCRRNAARANGPIAFAGGSRAASISSCAWS